VELRFRLGDVEGLDPGLLRLVFHANVIDGKGRGLRVSFHSN
jgi:hypothetical protein